MEKTIEEKIKSGCYTNKLRCPPKKRKSKKALNQWVAYTTESNALKETFKRDVLEAFGLSDHPKADKIFEEVWFREHSKGLLRVAEKIKAHAQSLKDQERVQREKKLRKEKYASGEKIQRSWNLWLDDTRDPMSHYERQEWEDRELEAPIWCTSFSQGIAKIRELGLPNYLFLDFNLGTGFAWQTGLDFLKLLEQEGYTNEPPPEYCILSAHPGGAKEMRDFMEDWKKEWE